MLAYVFWHWPAENVAADRYVERLLAFHRTLAASPCPGFHGSEVFAVEGEPWPGASAAQELFARMPPGNALWMRQMVLGPAPEFRLAGPPPPGIAARPLRVRSLHRSEI